METKGSVLTPRIPFRGPSLASVNILFTSSAVVSFLDMNVKSRIETTGVGTRIEWPFSLPSSSGITIPTALAAPVVVGMMDCPAARARRRSLCSRSRSLWSLVYEWIVVIRPFSIPSVSLRTLVSGAMQFVVQEALEIILCSAGL